MNYIRVKRLTKKFLACALAMALSVVVAMPMTAQATEANAMTFYAEIQAKEAAKALKEQISQTFTMEKKSTTTSHVKEMGYICYRAVESKEEKLPLVIYLHGKDGCGSNLDRLLQIEGIPQYIDRGLIYPNAVVIAPQCPSGSNWTKLADDVMELIEQVIEEENIDPSRISLTGASLGGIGTFNIAIKNPTFFSAVVPVCGSVNAGNCKVLTDVEVKIFHGTLDTGMGFSCKTAAQVITDNGGRCELNMLEGEGHEIRHVYVDEEYDLVNWMIAQQRSEMVQEEVEASGATAQTVETADTIIDSLN